MTPKEKAKELVKKHTIFLGDDGALKEYWTDELDAKRHSLKTINEILEELFEMAIVTGSSYVRKNIDYYQEVKQEIENL